MWTSTRTWISHCKTVTSSSAVRNTNKSTRCIRTQMNECSWLYSRPTGQCTCSRQALICQAALLAAATLAKLLCNRQSKQAIRPHCVRFKQVCFTMQHGAENAGVRQHLRRVSALPQSQIDELRVSPAPAGVHALQSQSVNR